MPALSVLDQSPVPAGSSAAQALANTVALARRCELLGYRRYWLAEHHATGGLAGPAPEVMVARVAAATERIRVGSGGVMLPHYSALKVAEEFHVLECLFPGRIDLGLGRAPGGTPLSTMALRTGPEPRYGPQVADLIGFLEDRLDPSHPFAALRATPVPSAPPPVWLLGSSEYSALVAAALGTGFSFAHFIHPGIGPEVAAAYRERFQPTERMGAPALSVGVNVICAPTSEEAIRLASSTRLWRRRLSRGDPGPIPTVEEALEELGPAGTRAPRDPAGRLIVGTPEEVTERLIEIAGGYGADELVVLTICHDHAARERSYALLADAFSLVPASAGTAAP
jgi:luciferase family oxidoreductase group 1